MPSFQGIQNDCTVIVRQLSAKLREQFRDKDVSVLLFHLGAAMGLSKARCVQA